MIRTLACSAVAFPFFLLVLTVFCAALAIEVIGQTLTRRERRLE